MYIYIYIYICKYIYMHAHPVPLPVTFSKARRKLEAKAHRSFLTHFSEIRHMSFGFRLFFGIWKMFLSWDRINIKISIFTTRLLC